MTERGLGDSKTGETFVEQSARAGGRYKITLNAKWLIDDGGLNDDYQKARLTTMLVNEAQVGH